MDLASTGHRTPLFHLHVACHVEENIPSQNETLRINGKGLRPLVLEASRIRADKSDSRRDEMRSIYHLGGKRELQNRPSHRSFARAARNCH